MTVLKLSEREKKMSSTKYLQQRWESEASEWSIIQVLKEKTIIAQLIYLAKLSLRECDIDMFTTNKPLLKELLKDVLCEEHRV